MSSENGRAMEEAAAGIVRRVVSLPRNIVGGFSRAIGAARRNQNHHFPPPPPPPPSYHFSPPAFPAAADWESEKWVFADGFERQYGPVHPFFYPCRFSEAMRMSGEEGKPAFVYLHSPDHPFTAAFCRETLCSEVVAQFLDANFVSWAAIENRGEGPQVVAMLRPSGFPFCAVAAPASGDSIAVFRKIEGPVSPAEMVEILQGTLEEQGRAFGSSRAKEEEKRRVDRRRLQEEQDAAYLAALKIDTEKERLRISPSAEAVHGSVETPSTSKKNPVRKEELPKVKVAATRETQKSKEKANEGKGPKDTQILLRFPNGDRRELSFSRTDKIRSVYECIDSLGLLGVGTYRLISSFPRRVFGADQMGMTLKDAGLHPRASLFLELL